MSSSLYPVLWAMKFAPVADVQERIILIYMADRGDPDGCHSYPSPKKIANYAMLNEKTVTERMKAMRQRGLIGYQAGPPPKSWFKLRADRRTVIYEIKIPASFWSAVQLEEINQMRAERADFGDDINSQPITGDNRPDIAAPPVRGRKTRSDKGKQNPKRSPKRPTPTAGDESGDDDDDGGTRPDAHGGGDTGAPPAPPPATEAAQPPENPDLTSDDAPRGEYDTPRADDAGGIRNPPTGGIRKPARGVSYTPNPPKGDPPPNDPPRSVPSVRSYPQVVGAAPPPDTRTDRDHRTEDGGVAPTLAATDLVESALAALPASAAPLRTPEDVQQIAAQVQARLNEGFTPEQMRHALHRGLAAAPAAWGLMRRATEPSNWLGDAAPPATEPTSTVEPWCGTCSDPTRRQEEAPDGRPRRCSTCHPLRTRHPAF